MSEGDVRLDRLLGGDAFATLRKRLRRHFEREKADRARGVFRLSAVSPHEYEALASLMGRPLRYASSIQVDVEAIDRALRRANIAVSLRAALQRLDGPIVHLASARDAARSRWSAVAAASRHTGLARYLGTATGLGVLKRLSQQDPIVAARLRERADAVLARLPAEGLPRAQLAAETLGDAHALDGGQPTATLVLAVWRQGDGSSDLYEDIIGDDGHREGPARDVWARAGVLVNELARPVLFLNMPTGGADLAVASGEPSYASLRMLLRSPPSWAVAGRDVYLCENPNVIAIAADRLGARCAPMACTDGMPAAAQRTLLAHLAKAGARLNYHGDFDWPGLRIANLVIGAYGARPWRLGAADYVSAVEASPCRELRLSGLPVVAAWDAALAAAMLDRGVAIPEEGVVALLLDDLQR
jgi:uncharacterized protein (TIGR02679 family)